MPCQLETFLLNPSDSSESLPACNQTNFASDSKASFLFQSHRSKKICHLIRMVYAKTCVPCCNIPCAPLSRRQAQANFTLFRRPNTQQLSQSSSKRSMAACRSSQEPVSTRPSLQIWPANPRNST